MSKKDPVKFTVEYENRLDELKNRLALRMKEAERSHRRFQIFVRVFMTAVILLLLSTVSFAGYQIYKDFQMNNLGKEFCLAGGFVYGDLNCIESLSDGSVKIHEINYYEKQWSFIKE